MAEDMGRYWDLDECRWVDYVDGTAVFVPTQTDAVEAQVAFDAAEVAVAPV